METVGRHNIQTTAVDVQYSYIQISKHHPSVKNPKNCNHTYIPVELRTFPSPLQHVWAADPVLPGVWGDMVMQRVVYAGTATGILWDFVGHICT